MHEGCTDLNYRFNNLMNKQQVQLVKDIDQNIKQLNMETFLLNHKLDMAFDYNDSIKECIPMIDGNASDDDEKDHFGRM